MNSTAQAFNVLDIGKNCGITFVNGKPLLEEVRIIKTHEELENMRLSARVADSAFEKACAISGYLLGVNPFNQPGVESYKKNMFALLGKPGYEEQRAALEQRLAD